MNSARTNIKAYATQVNSTNNTIDEKTGNESKLPPVPMSLSAIFNPHGVKRNTLIGPSSTTAPKISEYNSMSMDFSAGPQTEAQKAEAAKVLKN